MHLQAGQDPSKLAEARSTKTQDMQNMLAPVLAVLQTGGDGGGSKGEQSMACDWDRWPGAKWAYEWVCIGI